MDGLVKNIPGFRDEAIYRGEQVFFYKRAQILAADLHAAFGMTLFSDIDKMTMFPDYRVPQILRERAVLVYSPDLQHKIDSLTEIPHSAEEEIEIRAACIKVCDSLAELAQKLPIEIDWLLWQLGEKCLKSLKPHHRTLSIFY